MLATDEVVLAYVRPSGKKQESYASYEQSSSLKDLAIIRRFDFESKLQRMSVLTKNM